MNRGRLVFAYNADAGIAAALLDMVHKIASPATYPCSLCAITYGAVSMRRQWRDWLKELPVQPVFHHRPDFRAAYPQASDWTLPLVAVERGTALQPLIAAPELNAIADLGELIALLEARLP